jgi:uroporphyrinogen decarboxylase
MPKTTFNPDYLNILQVLFNKKPQRLPLYEHSIDPQVMGQITHQSFNLQGNNPADYQDYYKQIIRFWQCMTYDAFAYEASVCDCFPGHGAIRGGKGPIQSRNDFEKYPFADIPHIFRQRYLPHFEAIRTVLPAGMKAYGGCGYGVFEASEDLVGFESLCIMQFEDAQLFADLYQRLGDLYIDLWSWLIERYQDIFVFFRMGDDLGYKASTLMSPETYRRYLFPQYKRIIDLIHRSGKKFLLHSCGNIFSVMDDLIELGIDAKHSNEDIIAPFDKWIDLYNNRIGLFGGIDMNDLCLYDADTVYKWVLEKGREYRNKAKGYGFSSGNSIAEYIPPDTFMAMIEAVKEIRATEKL